MKATYRSMNERINPSESLREKVLAKVEQPKCLNLRPVAVVAALLVVLPLATPVMAAYVPPVTELMYQVAPEMAARFSPIQESCTKNGIKMEVVSASIHGTTAEICISFEDLEGDRIDASTFVREESVYGKGAFMSGSISGGYGNSDYEDETGKLILISERNFSFYSEQKDRNLTVKELFGGKMTVNVAWLYGFTELPVTEIPMILTDNEVMTVKVDREKAADHPQGVPFDGFGYGSSVIGDPWLGQEEYELLMPGESVYEITEELDVMGMAYIEGRFHVQMRLQAKDEDASPVYHVYFTDGNDNTVGYTNHNTFEIQKGADRGEYEELIFDIPEAQLDSYTLMCQVSEQKVIKGPWRVTFPITESDYVGEHDDGVPLVTVPGDGNAP